jgi:hypothetical protein
MAGRLHTIPAALFPYRRMKQVLLKLLSVLGHGSHAGIHAEVKGLSELSFLRNWVQTGSPKANSVAPGK